MLIARLFPKKSTFFEQNKEFFKKLGITMDSGGWIQLFTIWTLVVAGIVINQDSIDRYIYWEWSGWDIGFIKLGLVTVLYLFLLKPKNLWCPGKEVLDKNQFLIHGMLASILLLIGWVDLESSPLMIPIVIPYCFAFLSGLLVFQFPLELDEEKGVWNHFNWGNKIEIFTSSLILMVIALLMGIYWDDPILSSSAAISIPFPLIALIWPNHVRHLQRARIFPIFTFAMALCIRVPWFFLPLGLLFFVIRTINYFRYGIVYPSFAVDFLEEE